MGTLALRVADDISSRGKGGPSSVSGPAGFSHPPHKALETHTGSHTHHTTKLTVQPSSRTLRYQCLWPTQENMHCAAGLQGLPYCAVLPALIGQTDSAAAYITDTVFSATQARTYSGDEARDRAAWPAVVKPAGMLGWGNSIAADVPARWVSGDLLAWASKPHARPEAVAGTAAAWDAATNLRFLEGASSASCSGTGTSSAAACIAAGGATSSTWALCSGPATVGAATAGVRRADWKARAPDVRRRLLSRLRPSPHPGSWQCLSKYQTLLVFPSSSSCVRRVAAQPLTGHL